MPKNEPRIVEDSIHAGTPKGYDKDMKVGQSLNLDRLGAFASAVCAVHCLITGVALGLLSVVGLGFLGSPQAEAGFFFTTLTIGTVALIHGRRRHHSMIPAIIFVTGLACLLISHFVFGHEGHGNRLGPTILNVMGGLSLVLFHCTNQRMQHGCACSTCTHVEN